MFDFLKLLTKRPSDNFIRLWRIIFGLILILSIYYNLIYQWDNIDDIIFGTKLTNQNIIYIKYVLLCIWIIPIIMGVFNLCILKSKYIRIIQILFWIFLFFISSLIKESPNLDIDVLLIIMGILPLIAWITWKCITKKCLRYKQKITKIRV